MEVFNTCHVCALFIAHLQVWALLLSGSATAEQPTLLAAENARAVRRDRAAVALGAKATLDPQTARCFAQFGGERHAIPRREREIHDRRVEQHDLVM